MRIKRGTLHVKRRRTLRAKTKGYRWARKSSIRLGRVAAIRAGVNAYRHRRERKQDFRRLWQVRVNAGARTHELSYSKLIHGLKLAKVELNRKMLSELAAEEPETFAAIVALAKKQKA